MVQRINGDLDVESLKRLFLETLKFTASCHLTIFVREFIERISINVFLKGCLYFFFVSLQKARSFF